MSKSVLQKTHLHLQAFNYFETYVNALGMTAIDAKGYLNKFPHGILVQGIEESMAERLQGLLAEDGIETVILDDSQINEFELIPTRKAFIGDQITYEDVYGREVHFDYTNLAAIAITSDPATSMKGMMDREHFLDLVFKDGTGKL